MTPALLLSGAVLGFSASITGLLAYEFLAILNGWPTISYHVQAVVNQQPWVELGTALLIGALLGHFWH